MSDQIIKVLVVDDEEGLADFMQKILSLKGFLAFKEIDGTGAVNIFKQERPDIVLVDVDLGYSEINGLEVLRRIKEIDKNAICIVITRITDEKTVAKSKEYGAFHYLLKPLDSKDIVSVVNEAAQIIQQKRSL